MIIKNGMVYTADGVFSNKTVETCNAYIKNVYDNQDFPNAEGNDSSSVYDASDCYVIPGLVDVHFHGSMGYDFCGGTWEGIDAIARFQLSKGVTTICPATMTLPVDELVQILETGFRFHKEHSLGSLLQGIHLEGPFVSHAKKGAQNANYIIEPSTDVLDTLMNAAPNLVKLITVAPEVEHAMDFIKENHGKIAISLGHTAAGYDLAKEAFDAGACHATHLYNAMSSFTHRDSGIVGAAFDSKDAFVELICDGIHISDSVIRATFQLFTQDRIVLISDSMEACGMKNGTYSLGGQKVTVKGSLATLDDGTIAGSVTNLMDCMTYAVKNAGVPLEAAVKAATINPAKSIGIEALYGSIFPGKIANFVILNKDLSIKNIIFIGKIIK